MILSSIAVIIWIRIVGHDSFVCVMNVLNLRNGLLHICCCSRRFTSSAARRLHNQFQVVELLVAVCFLVSFAFFLQLEPLNEALCRVKDTKSLFAANKTPLRFAVMFQGAGLAEIMLTPAVSKFALNSPSYKWIGESLYYLETTGCWNDSRQMKHLKGKSSSSECISYFESSSAGSPFPLSSRSNCHPNL